jgi:hypothetical protein
MTESHRSPSTVLWNTVLPGLGVALVLGAPVLLALVVAAVVSVLITAAASPLRAAFRTP